MSQAVVFDCPNRGKGLVASFDITKDAETKCSNCDSIIVFPVGAAPFVKKTS